MKDIISNVLHHPLFNYLSSFFFVLLYLQFIVSHVTAIQAGAASPSIMIFVLMETTVMVMYIFRTQPKKRAVTFFPWFFAIAGTFLPLTLSPAGTILNSTIGNVFVTLGGILALGAYLSLNTSHGTAPALRKVKTKGLYAIIRHPMYFAYFVIFTGYVNLLFSPLNLAIIATTIFCLSQRVRYEEALLRESPEYVAYTKKVKYRFIPFVY